MRKLICEFVKTTFLVYGVYCFIERLSDYKAQRIIEAERKENNDN